MKQLKLMLVCALSLVFSCSSEEETYDFSGVWNLNFINMAPFYSNLRSLQYLSINLLAQLPDREKEIFGVYSF